MFFYGFLFATLCRDPWAVLPLPLSPRCDFHLRKRSSRDEEDRTEETPSKSAHSWTLPSTLKPMSEFFSPPG